MLAYPSRYEGFGFPPLQAMAAGVPVVATAAGSVPEVVGAAAATVPVGDTDALAAALARVLDDRDHAAWQVEVGRERAALFTWESLATGMTVQVRLFAIAREKAGRSEIEVNLPDPATVADLRRALADRFPDLDSVTLGAMIAVDEEYAGDAAIIGPASRLAMIPPVSGGSDEA